MERRKEGHEEASLLGQEVVGHVQGRGEVVVLAVDVRLDLALAGVERRAKALDLLRAGRAGDLRLELRAERGVGLGDEVGADVGPRSAVGRLDRDLGVGEVADLDLRRHLRLHERQDLRTRRTWICQCKCESTPALTRPVNILLPTERYISEEILTSPL